MKLIGYFLIALPLLAVIVVLLEGVGLRGTLYLMGFAALSSACIMGGQTKSPPYLWKSLANTHIKEKDKNGTHLLSRKSL